MSIDRFFKNKIRSRAWVFKECQQSGCKTPREHAQRERSRGERAPTSGDFFGSGIRGGTNYPHPEIIIRDGRIKAGIGKRDRGEGDRRNKPPDILGGFFRRRGSRILCALGIMCAFFDPIQQVSAQGAVEFADVCTADEYQGKRDELCPATYDVSALAFNPHASGATARLSVLFEEIYHDIWCARKSYMF